MYSDPLDRICPNLLQDAEHDFFPFPFQTLLILPCLKIFFPFTAAFSKKKNLDSRSWISTFPFTAFYSKTCNYELWMVRSRIPSFLIPFSLQSFLLRQLQEWTLDGRSWIPTFHAIRNQIHQHNNVGWTIVNGGPPLFFFKGGSALQ